MRKGITGFAVLVVSLLILAGCGGDSSTVSKEEYERQLELVCNEGIQEREDLFRTVSQEYEELSEEEQTTQVEVENLRKLIAGYQGTTEKIADLDLPEGNEEKAEELVREREEVAAKIQASPLGTRDSLGTIFDTANGLAESFGGQSCTF